jgi:hypothetical protein
MGLTPKEMKIAMDAGKVLTNGFCRAYLKNGIYAFVNSIGIELLMSTEWNYKDWQIYEEQKPVFPFKCFDKVLVRHAGQWSANFFNKTCNVVNGYPFLTIGGSCWASIAPYEGNEDFENNPTGVKGIWTKDML